jgi:hypothetical protein
MVNYPQAAPLFRSVGMCRRLATSIINIESPEDMVVHEQFMAPTLRELRIYGGP